MKGSTSSRGPWARPPYPTSKSLWIEASAKCINIYPANCNRGKKHRLFMDISLLKDKRVLERTERPDGVTVKSFSVGKNRVYSFLLHQTQSDDVFLNELVAKF